MRRREFISLLGGSVVAWPLSAGAQKLVKRPTIGFLGSDATAWSPYAAAFAERLRALGWIESCTISIEYRWDEARRERDAEIAAEFVHQNVDIIVAFGAAVPALKRDDVGHTYHLCCGDGSSRRGTGRKFGETRR